MMAVCDMIQTIQQNIRHLQTPVNNYILLRHSAYPIFIIYSKACLQNSPSWLQMRIHLMALHFITLTMAQNVSENRVNISTDPISVEWHIQGKVTPYALPQHIILWCHFFAVSFFTFVFTITWYRINSHGQCRSLCVNFKANILQHLETANVRKKLCQKRNIRILCVRLVKRLLFRLVVLRVRTNFSDDSNYFIFNGYFSFE